MGAFIQELYDSSIDYNDESYNYKSNNNCNLSIEYDESGDYSKLLVANALRAQVQSIDLDNCHAGGEDSFFVADIGKVYHQHLKWQKYLPRVEPFYAVKCNNDPGVLKLLASLDLGFDCASINEIDTILNLGVDPSRIVYAHPCKPTSYIRNAAVKDVKLMTFDNSGELYKVARFFPNAQLLLRIMTDDSKALCQLSVKYGADMDTVPELLALAQNLGLDVVGVSFHVGSGAYDPDAYIDAITNARKVFDQGLEMGMPPMRLLDIGGGYVDETFEATANLVSNLIDDYFDPSVRVIAEPGRYYVSSAFTIATHVIARRWVDEPGRKAMLYINDGVYGNMNCIIFDHQAPVPKVLVHNNKFAYGSEVASDSAYSSCNSSDDEADQPLDYEMSIWGPTCDGIDCITKSCRLSYPLDVGDWIYFNDFGAYTLSASTTFNGFNTKCSVVYVCSDERAAAIVNNTKPE